MRDLIAAAQRAHDAGRRARPPRASAPPSSPSPRRVSRREAEDLSGPALAALAEEAGCEVVAMEVVPDDFALIEDRLHHFVDDGCDLDLHHRRHRADARRRHARGDARGDRARGARLRRGDARRGRCKSHAARHPHARRVRASPGRTLIVNFPGSPKAIDELFPVLAPTLSTWCAPCAGDSSHHGDRDRAG